jgi:hypothetical protein
MEKVSQIRIDKNLDDFLMVAARFENFFGECVPSASCNENYPGRCFGKMVVDCNMLVGNVSCATLDFASEMLNCRLTYDVRVLKEGSIDSYVKVVLVLFTDREVLGCVKVKIPDIPFDRRDDEWITGHIDFVPLRRQAGEGAWTRVGAGHPAPTSPQPSSLLVSPQDCYLRHHIQASR